MSLTGQVYLHCTGRGHDQLLPRPPTRPLLDQRGVRTSSAPLRRRTCILEDSTMRLSTIRLLVIFALGTLWLPLAAAAPPKKVPTIGVLLLESPPSEPDWKQRSVFLQELRHLGWRDGENVTVEFRWASRQFDRAGDLAAELVRLNVDVIHVVMNVTLIRAVQH